MDVKRKGMGGGKEREGEREDIMTKGKMKRGRDSG